MSKELKRMLKLGTLFLALFVLNMFFSEMVVSFRICYSF